MKDFKDLKVWEKAHSLALAVYQATSRFPREEMYGLTSQVRRSCSSIAANIAEGCGESDAELARFCQIAMGSASELEYHLLLSRDLKFLDTQEHSQIENNLIEVKRMLTSFIQKLRADR